MKMLLYELWLFPVVNIAFWNMFLGWGPGFALNPALLPGGLGSAACHPEHDYHVYSLFPCVLRNHSFFKKSNLPFMKQYKLDAFSKQVPKTILEIIFKVTKQF